MAEPPESLSLLHRTPSMARLLFSSPQIHQELFSDKVFSHTEWARHRNAAWRHRIEPLVFLRVASGFVWQLVWVVLVAVGVGMFHTIDKGEHDHLDDARLASVFSMITFALSLLLVFKTNSSFGRWWEARIIWGQIVNFGRNFPRLVLHHFPPSKGHLTAMAMRWAAAGPHTLKVHIRGGPDLCSETAALLSPTEQDLLHRWGNAPQGVAHVLTRIVVEAGLDPITQSLLYQQIDLFVNMAGGCERIFKTPIPSAYTRHTSRFLMIYLTAMPVLLWPPLRWATPAVAALIAFLLLGVENIGVQIEEPFSVLPLDAICKGIESGIREMVRLHSDAQHSVLHVFPVTAPMTEPWSILTSSPVPPLVPDGGSGMPPAMANGCTSASSLGSAHFNNSMSLPHMSGHLGSVHLGMGSATQMHHTGYPAVAPAGLQMAFAAQQAAQQAALLQQQQCCLPVTFGVASLPPQSSEASGHFARSSFHGATGAASGAPHRNVSADSPQSSPPSGNTLDGSHRTLEGSYHMRDGSYHTRDGSVRGRGGMMQQQQQQQQQQQFASGVVVAATAAAAAAAAASVGGNSVSGPLGGGGGNGGGGSIAMARMAPFMDPQYQHMVLMNGANGQGGAATSNPDMDDGMRR